MGAALDLVFRGLNVAMDMQELYTQFNELCDNPQKRTMENIASILAKAGILFCNGMEIRELCGEGKNAKLAEIKLAETTVRAINVPIEIKRVIVEYQENPAMTKMRVIEKSLVPIAALVRASAELTIYKEKAYLDLPPDEMAKQTRPDGVMGKKPVIVEECHAAIATATKVKEQSNLFEYVTKQGIVSKVTDKFPDMCQKVMEYLKIKYPAQADPFNLSGLGYIPVELHTDPILSRYVCVISGHPIRDPVGDPDGRTYYERQMIVERLRTNATSPSTGEPLTIEMLIPKPALKALIDNRLRMIETRVRQIARRLNAPINTHPVLTMRANIENPHRLVPFVVGA